MGMLLLEIELVAPARPKRSTLKFVMNSEIIHHAQGFFWGTGLGPAISPKSEVVAGETCRIYCAEVGTTHNRGGPYKQCFEATHSNSAANQSIVCRAAVDMLLIVNE
jgi:hypothetical protein